MTQDTGCRENWIHPKLVADLSLTSTKVPAISLVDFQGTQFQSNHCVLLTYLAKGMSTEQMLCRVAPEGAPFEMLVGFKYLEANGFDTFEDAGKVESALVLVGARTTVSGEWQDGTRTPRPALMRSQESEKSHMKELRAQKEAASAALEKKRQEKKRKNNETNGSSGTGSGGPIPDQRPKRQEASK